MIKRLLLAATLLFSPAAASARWHQASSSHFVVYSDDDPDRLRAFATRLEKFDKAMRTLRGMSDTPVGSANRLSVYVVPNIGAVQKLAGKGPAVANLAGFYVGRASGSVAFVPRRAGFGGTFDLDADTVFFHEYAHHVILGHYSGAFPAWFSEGFAEFHSTAGFGQDGSVGLGLPPLQRAYQWGSAGSLPLPKMLSGDYTRLTEEQTGILYARGWLLTHYLLIGQKDGAGQLDTYLRLIGEGKPAGEASTAAFGDLEKLDKELDAYIRRKTIMSKTILASALTIGPVAVRALTPGEAAFMPTRLRSVRGVDDNSAKALVPAARRAAAPFAADVTVQAWLAEVEHDANNLAEAEAAADRALAIDPNSVDALIYKGRVQMKQAVLAKAPDKATWRAVRRWFIEVGRIDTEATEPKMLFHESFVAEGAEPTRNAVKALAYAQQLAPQDESLRLQVVFQHLKDGETADTRRLLGRIAFDPHGGEMRARVQEMMVKLAANDAKGALALWARTSEDNDKKD